MPSSEDQFYSIFFYLKGHKGSFQFWLHFQFHVAIIILLVHQLKEYHLYILCSISFCFFVVKITYRGVDTLIDRKCVIFCSFCFPQPEQLDEWKVDVINLYTKLFMLFSLTFMCLWCDFTQALHFLFALQNQGNDTSSFTFVVSHLKDPDLTKGFSKVEKYFIYIHIDWTCI